MIDRPLGVTIVAVIVWLDAVLQIGNAIVVMLNEGFGGGLSADMASAAFDVLVGVIAFVIAFGLLRGRNAARIAITVILAIAFVADLWTAVSLRSSVAVSGVGAVLELIGIVLLWTRPANLWFRPA